MEWMRRNFDVQEVKRLAWTHIHAIACDDEFYKDGVYLPSSPGGLDKLLSNNCFCFKISSRQIEYFSEFSLFPYKSEGFKQQFF